jgi:hypothetical protein
MRHLMCVLVAIAFGAPIACGGSSNAVVADSPPPLPPTEATSVRVLLIEDRRLELTDDQRAGLRGLAVELEDANRPLREQLAELEESMTARRATRPSPTATTSTGGKRGGAGGGQMRGGGGGMRGGTSARGGDGGMRGAGTTRSGERPMPGPGSAERAAMFHNNQIALARALALLDQEQRETAAHVLDLHGHEMPDPQLADSDYVSGVAAKR